MAERDGSPLWASLFGEGPQERKKSFAPWYRREAGVWKELSWAEVVCGEVPVENRRYVSLDVETTGLYAQGDRIVEIALVRFSFDSEGAILEEDRFSSLVNPECPIPEKARSIHGIADGDVANAPPFRELADTVLECMKGRVVVGHNVRFDADFVEAEMARAGRFFVVQECADSLGMAKLAYPGMRSYNLGMLAYSLEIPSNAQHRALGDALASMQLFALSARSLSGRCT